MALAPRLHVPKPLRFVLAAGALAVSGMDLWLGRNTEATVWLVVAVCWILSALVARGETKGGPET